MKIKNVGHRREVVTAVRQFDTENGILNSQQAKYEKPNWYFVLAVLPSRRSKALSVEELSAKLARKGLNISTNSLQQTLRMMMNLDQSIHPHRRNCGVGCYEAVNAMGGISFDERPSRGRNGKSRLYFLDAKPSRLSYYRRAFNITLKP